MGQGYSIHEIEKGVGVSARTIRYWIRVGVLPRSQGRGRNARYTEEQLLKAKFIQKFRGHEHPLKQIGTRLKDLSMGEIAALLQDPAPAAAPITNLSGSTLSTSAPPLPLPAAAVPASPAPHRTTPVGDPTPTPWFVWSLGKGLVLMLSSAAEADVRARADAICRAYLQP